MARIETAAYAAGARLHDERPLQGGGWQARVERGGAEVVLNLYGLKAQLQGRDNAFVSEVDKICRSAGCKTTISTVR